MAYAKFWPAVPTFGEYTKCATDGSHWHPTPRAVVLKTPSRLRAERAGTILHGGCSGVMGSEARSPIDMKGLLESRLEQDHGMRLNGAASMVQPAESDSKQGPNTTIPSRAE